MGREEVVNLVCLVIFVSGRLTENETGKFHIRESRCFMGEIKEWKGRVKRQFLTFAGTREWLVSYCSSRNIFSFVCI